MQNTMISQGLRTVIYHVPDLARAKAWYSVAFGVLPYFDEPSYVGFNIGGFELGLDPDMSGVEVGSNVVAYWGVADAGEAYRDLVQKGAGEHSPVQEVGGGIRVATVTDPFGNVLGLIENPHFQLQAPPAVGPGFIA
jgi:predicted enzyme related to lactoylglutathione lyase